MKKQKTNRAVGKLIFKSHGMFGVAYQVTINFFLFLFFKKKEKENTKKEEVKTSCELISVRQYITQKKKKKKKP